MCRNCGALVGASETACSLCGTPKTSAIAPQAQTQVSAHDGETIRFARAVLNRPYIFTIIFLVANIFVFMLMTASGGSENYDTLKAYGAKLNALINAGEWWRFVTPIFIHIGPIHLLVNMYGLWMIGPYVERLYGSAKFVVLWVVTGIAGFVASYYSLQPNMQGGALGRFFFRAMDGPAAGASGALFGLIGVLFVFGIKYRRELPEGFKRAFGTGLLPIILINLFVGYLGRKFIDNAAHVGGLVSGAVFALVIGYKRPGERASVAVFWHILQVLALLLVAVSFVMVALHYNGPPPSLNNINARTVAGGGGGDKLMGYLNAINGGQNAFLKALGDEDASNDASNIETAIKQLDAAEPPDQATAALRDELKALLVRARDLPAQPGGGGAGARAKQRVRVQRQRELLRDFEAWVNKSNEWVKTEGEKYGITLQEPRQPADNTPQEK
jgi:rhomboid protease GluP